MKENMMEFETEKQRKQIQYRRSALINMMNKEMHWFPNVKITFDQDTSVVKFEYTRKCEDVKQVGVVYIKAVADGYKLYIETYPTAEGRSILYKSAKKCITDVDNWISARWYPRRIEDENVYGYKAA